MSNKNENININNRIEFLKASIADAQDTIRSIDIKMEIILGIIVLIIGGMFSNIETCSNNFFLILTIMVSFLTIGAILLTLLSKNNPIKHVKIDRITHNNICSAFFGNSYINNTDQTVDFDKLLMDVCGMSDDDLLKELLFDFSKLIYIRDSKLKKQIWVFRLSSISIISYIVFFVINFITF
jgi:hypothetical protein